MRAKPPRIRATALLRAVGAVVLTLVTAACAGQKDSIDPIYDETSLVALTASQDISTSPFHKKGYMILMGERGVSRLPAARRYAYGQDCLG